MQSNDELKKTKFYLTHINPWSVAKSAFMFGLTIAVVLSVMSTVLWLLLSAAGVFDAIVGLFSDVSGNSNFSISFLSLGRLLGLTMLVSAVEIAAFTVLSALFAVLYNLSVGFTGGISLTFTEHD